MKCVQCGEMVVTVKCYNLSNAIRSDKKPRRARPLENYIPKISKRIGLHEIIYFIIY